MAPNRHAAFMERVGSMKKAMLSVVTAVAALSVFSGCSSGREPSQNNDGETCPIYSGSYKIWDASLAERVFFPDYDSFTENDIEYSKLESDSVRIDDPRLGKGLYNLYRFKDGRELFCDAGTIVYNKDVNDMHSYMNISKFDVYPSKDIVQEFYPLREIEGQPSDNALKITGDIVEQLDIPCLGEPQIYTCTGTACDDNGNELVPPKDAYYILYHASVDNIDLPYQYTIFTSVGQSGSYGFAEFIVTADGLEYCDIQYIFDYQEKDTRPIISREKAVEILQNTVGRATESGKTEYSTGKLTYIADANSETGESTLYPVWLFIKSTEKESAPGDENAKISYKRIFIDAQTGLVLN